MFIFFTNNVKIYYMRISAGKFKNRNLEFVSNETTRPTASVVREALFSKIQLDLEGKIFLDLFSGSGSVGIEALSRGAGKTFFVEKNRKNAEIIKRNLETCKASKDEFEIAIADFLMFLERSNEKFDFIFIDPPYKNLEFYSKAAEIVERRKLLADDGIIICEHEAKNEIMLDGFELQTRKKYGIKMLSYFTLKTESQNPPSSD